MEGREHAGSAGPPLIQETAGPHSLQVASSVNTDGKGPGYPEAGTVSLGTGRGQAGESSSHSSSPAFQTVCSREPSPVAVHEGCQNIYPN